MAVSGQGDRQLLLIFPLMRFLGELCKHVAIEQLLDKFTPDKRYAGILFVLKVQPIQETQHGVEVKLLSLGKSFLLDLQKSIGEASLLNV